MKVILDLVYVFVIGKEKVKFIDESLVFLSEGNEEEKVDFIDEIGFYE